MQDCLDSVFLSHAPCNPVESAFPDRPKFAPLAVFGNQNLDAVSGDIKRALKAKGGKFCPIMSNHPDIVARLIVASQATVVYGLKEIVPAKSTGLWCPWGVEKNSLVAFLNVKPLTPHAQAEFKVDGVDEKSVFKETMLSEN